MVNNNLVFDSRKWKKLFFRLFVWNNFLAVWIYFDALELEFIEKVIYEKNFELFKINFLIKSGKFLRGFWRWGSYRVFALRLKSVLMTIKCQFWGFFELKPHISALIFECVSQNLLKIWNFPKSRFYLGLLIVKERIHVFSVWFSYPSP